MNVIVATKNPVKIEATRDALTEFESFSHATLEGVLVPSGVSEQPLPFQETVLGSKNRAKAAWNSYACKSAFLSIGIESGLMLVGDTSSGDTVDVVPEYINFTACSVYNGDRCTLGISHGFLVPPVVVQALITQGISLGDAFHHLALTEDAYLASGKGCIHMLTGGRVTRKDLTYHAVVMALVPYISSGLYFQ